jgi:hypothetical protein
MNDAPVVPSGQVLTIPNPLAAPGAAVGNVSATDQDAGAWASGVAFALVAPSLQTLYPQCAPSATQAGSLEEAYMVLTEQAVDFHTHTTSDRDQQ